MAQPVLKHKSFILMGIGTLILFYLLGSYYLRTRIDEYAINSPLFIKIHELYGIDITAVITTARALMIYPAAALLLLSVLLLCFPASFPQHIRWGTIALCTVSVCAILFFMLGQYFTGQNS
ncbi:hypothetical protein [Mucilaginibacter flavidus]|uniref:hypothetical protein n=1 Tax=Mucilaginibacter flavidus TaxID=2949309 RepID=UPI002092F5E0|nr:hypothetical protein [Mucilaginibacter flavidus]MCO5949885.1 hypothetical protein [Mucilaginibacter flavidus]